YKADDGNEYLLNLIDTPGHVDFTYEVSRSLAACEGALLLVDASQGVEAQTIANAHLAIENHLTVIPVINNVDLASPDLGRSRRSRASPRNGSGRSGWAAATSATWWPESSASMTRVSATPSQRPSDRRRSPFPGAGTPSRWSAAACTAQAAICSRICGTRSR